LTLEFSFMTDEDRPIRVALWSPRGAGLAYCGGGTAAYRLYNKDAQGRFALTLIHGEPAQADHALYEKQVRLGTAEGGLDQHRFIRAGQRWLAEHAGEFDVFHGLNAFHPTVRPAVTANRLGLPAVVKVGNHRADLADKPGLKRLLGLPRKRRRLIQELSGVIAISREIAEELRSYGLPAGKIAQIPNGVDTEQFHPADGPEQRTATREQLGWPDRPTLLFVGQVSPRKRPHLLVEALAAVHRRGESAQLVLAGPASHPEYAKSLTERAAALGLSEHLIWTGHVTDVAPLYRASDLFALPSQNEGLPNAVLEALASGLPALATATSGVGQLLGDGEAGRVVEPRGEAIGQAVAGYLSDPAQRAQHGQAGRRRIERDYSVPAVLDQHEQLFRRIMAGADAAG
jgi:glycosyltransferase involved in cell wall biosynthesis